MDEEFEKAEEEIEREDEETPEEEEKKNLTQLVFACSICNSVFKDPGLCGNCQKTLKAKAA